MNEYRGAPICPGCDTILDARSSHCPVCGTALSGAMRQVMPWQAPGTQEVLPATWPPYATTQQYQGPYPSMALPQSTQSIPYQAQPAAYSYPGMAAPGWNMPPQAMQQGQPMGVYGSVAQPMTMMPPAMGGPIFLGQPASPSVVVIQNDRPAPAPAPPVVVVNNQQHDGLALFGGMMALLTGGVVITGLFILAVLVALAAH